MRIGIGIGLPRSRLRGGNAVRGGLPVKEGLALLLDADLGITLNGPNVSAWADQGPQAANFIQSTPGLQLEYLPSWRNGKAALRGNVGSLLATAMITKPCTVFVVSEAQEPVSPISVFYDMTGGGGRSHVAKSAGGALQLFESSYGGAIALPPLATPMIFLARHEGVSSSSRVDPHALASATDASSAGSNQNTSTLIRLFNDTTQVAPFVGAIAYVLIYNRVLIPSEDASVLSYLSNLYDTVST